MREDSKHLGRVGEISPDNDFMMAVIGGAKIADKLDLLVGLLEEIDDNFRRV